MYSIDSTQEEKKNKKTPKKIYSFLGFFLVLVFSCFLFGKYILSAPKSLKQKTLVIKEGSSLIKVAQELEKEGVVRSRHALRILAELQNKTIKSGVYDFQKPQHLKRILARITAAEYGDVYVFLRIPEGSTNKQIQEIILKKGFENINSSDLKEVFSENEGMWFPDTYQFLPTASTFDIAEKISKNFEQKKQKAFANQALSKTEKEFVIMASIIEKEAANDLKQKQIISGILWKRIAEGIPLQVDAPFVYERGKGSFDLARKDLRTDSDYNTYTKKGLTPTAIGNPGYDSLYAAAHPIVSEYYFYLHGHDGHIRYGKNYKEHLKNKRIYLK